MAGFSANDYNKSMKEDRKVLKYILILFSGWRAVLLIITFFGISIIAKADMVNYQLAWPNSKTNYWLQWANWDGGHYLGIAEHGYQPVQTAFFPLYPLLIFLLKNIGIPALLAGLIITHISTVVALFYLYKLSRLDYPEDISKKTLLFLLIFPTSFYLGAVYSESLFLALTLSSFYYARKGKIFPAAILGGLSFATRIVGIATITGIFIEYLFNNKTTIKNYLLRKTFIRKIVLYNLISFFSLKLLLIPMLLREKLWIVAGSLITVNYLLLLTTYLAIFVYLLIFIKSALNFRKIFNKNFIYLLLSFVPFSIFIYYQYIIFKSPLGFLQNHAQWGKQLTAPWIAPNAALNFILSNNIFSVGNGTWTLIELIFAIVFIATFILTALKLRLSYTVFFLIALLMPLASGSLISIQRNGLILFPMYIIFALIKNEYLEKFTVMLSISSLIFLAILFINSYWIV